MHKKNHVSHTAQAHYMKRRIERITRRLSVFDEYDFPSNKDPFEWQATLAGELTFLFVCMQRLTKTGLYKPLPSDRHHGARQ